MFFPFNGPQNQDLLLFGIVFKFCDLAYYLNHCLFWLLVMSGVFRKDETQQGENYSVFCI